MPRKNDSTMEIRDRRGGFLWVANDVFDYFAKEVNPSTFMVYLALCRMAHNDDQTCHPSYEYLAAMLNMSRATVATCLKELRKLDLVEWETKGRSNEYTLVKTNSLKFRRVQFGESNSLKNDAKESSPLDPNKTKNKTIEQDYSGSQENAAHLMDSESVLFDDIPRKPAAKKSDQRHAPFKEKLMKFWNYLNKSDLYWTPADAKQLADFLKHWPTLTLDKFHEVLLNYMESENIVQSKTPKQFLPSLNLYFDSALDKFGKPVSDEKRTVH